MKTKHPKPNYLYRCPCCGNEYEYDEPGAAQVLNRPVFAAAPDMLAALEATKAYVNGEFTELDWVETCRAMDAAIAKAKGKGG